MIRSIPPRGSIPPSVRGRQIGVRIGIGGVGIPRKQPASASPIHTKPKIIGKGVKVLKELLAEARIHEKTVAHMLTVVPSKFPEYDDLLDRLAKLERLILQLNQQIIARESK